MIPSSMPEAHRNLSEMLDSSGREQARFVRRAKAAHKALEALGAPFPALYGIAVIHALNALESEEGQDNHDC